MSQSPKPLSLQETEWLDGDGDSACDSGRCHHYGCMEARGVDLAAVMEFGAHWEPCLRVDDRSCRHQICSDWEKHF